MNAWNYAHGAGYGVGPLGLLWTVLLLVALGALIYVVVRMVTKDRAEKAQATATAPTAQAAPVSSPRQILEERLARGEIEPEEFRERVKALEEA